MRAGPLLRALLVAAAVVTGACAAEDTADPPPPTAATSSTTGAVSVPCDPDPVVAQLRDGLPPPDYTPSGSRAELVDGNEVLVGRIVSGTRANGWWTIEVATDRDRRVISVPGAAEPGRLDIATDPPLVLAVGGTNDAAPTDFAAVPDGLWVACKAGDVAIAVIAAPAWALGASIDLLAG